MSTSAAMQVKTIRSTGPRTAQGKAASSRNAIRHGLTSKTLLVTGENCQEWESLLAGLMDEWKPKTATERLLVENMARHHWLVERSLRLQSEALASQEHTVELPPSFALLLRYQTTNERAFARSLKSLQELQKVRREFVSQKEKREAEEQFARNLARMQMPFPPPSYPDLLSQYRRKQDSDASSPSSEPFVNSNPIESTPDNR